MSIGTSCHFGHLLQVSKKSLWSLILFNFFHDFTHAYSPGAGADSHQGTKFWFHQKCLVTSLICCKFKKNSLKSDFIQLFYDFIHVYSPGAGQDSPQGTKFWFHQKCLVTYQLSRSLVFWFWRRRLFLRFLPYIGMAAILVMWPGPFE